MRRKLLSSALWLITVPFQWLMLSLAAWRALFQLFRAPHRWEKTAHGLAKTSRLDEIGTAAASDVLQAEPLTGDAPKRRHAA
jgi:hypothetical protein